MPGQSFTALGEWEVEDRLGRVLTMLCCVSLLLLQGDGSIGCGAQMSEQRASHPGQLVVRRPGIYGLEPLADGDQANFLNRREVSLIDWIFHDPLVLLVLDCLCDPVVSRHL